MPEPTFVLGLTFAVEHYAMNLGNALVDEASGDAEIDHAIKELQASVSEFVAQANKLRQAAKEKAAKRAAAASRRKDLREARQAERQRNLRTPRYVRCLRCGMASPVSAEALTSRRGVRCPFCSSQGLIAQRSDEYFMVRFTIAPRDTDAVCGKCAAWTHFSRLAPLVRCEHCGGEFLNPFLSPRTKRKFRSFLAQHGISLPSD